MPFPKLETFPDRRDDAPLYAKKKPPPPPIYPNVPVGTLGSKERPGIRAWFQNAAVLKQAIMLETRKGQAIMPETRKGDSNRDEDVQVELPPHLRAFKVPPPPLKRNAA